MSRRRSPPAEAEGTGALHPAARKLLTALAQHAPARFTWGQSATLAGFLWCSRLPSPAPEMLRTLAAQGERYMETTELALALGKKATGGHWNSGVALLRNNGLVEMSGKRLRVSELFR